MEGEREEGWEGVGGREGVGKREKRRRVRATFRPTQGGFGCLIFLIFFEKERDT